ncbi:MAG TPA: sigma-70 family RNA polymerase sigma factor [Chitinophagaceae bacterium]|nr:sigma-70 family RNA polymerase sigma factor [Chitinophagaceae bacterium]
MDNQLQIWDDESLVNGCLHNKVTAQKELYDRFSSSMLGLCFRYARSRADAEDILQEGFIKVFFNLKQYRAHGSLEGWIKKIMVTTAINYLKKNKNLTESLETEKAAIASAVLSSEHTLHTRDIISAIASMPPGYRTILNLYAIEGYSHKEISGLLGITESTSRSQYVRAKSFLSRILESSQKVMVSK